MAEYILIHGTFYEVDDELQHAGVKGMKWGVRKDGYESSGSSNRANQSANPMTNISTRKRKSSGSIKITSSTKQPGSKKTSKSKVTVKTTKKGTKFVAKNDNVKVKMLVANAANISAGALRVAAAFIPGASALNGVATAASLVGTVATIKK